MFCFINTLLAPRQRVEFPFLVPPLRLAATRPTFSAFFSASPWDTAALPLHPPLWQSVKHCARIVENFRNVYVKWRKLVHGGTVGWAGAFRWHAPNIYAPHPDAVQSYTGFWPGFSTGMLSFIPSYCCWYKTLCLCNRPCLLSFTYRTGSVYIMLAGRLGRKSRKKAFVLKIIQITWEGSHGYNIQSPLSVHIWRDLCVSTSSSCLNAVCCQIAAV